jgi:hypothetical protein
VVEPAVDFTEVEDVLHDRSRCQDTSLCHYFHTHSCPATGMPA